MSLSTGSHYGEYRVCFFEVCRVFVVTICPGSPWLGEPLAQHPKVVIVVSVQNIS